MAASVIARGQYTLTVAQDGYWGRIDPAVYQVVCDENGTPASGELGAGGKATFRVSASCGDDTLEMEQGTGAATHGKCKWYISSLQSGCTAAPLSGSPDTFYLQSITSDNAGVAIVFNFEGKETQTHTVQITKNRKGQSGEDGEDAKYIYLRGGALNAILPGEGEGEARNIVDIVRIGPDGENMTIQKRGLNVTTINRQTLQKVDSKNFDLIVNTEATAQSMADYLDTLDDTVFVCITSNDAYYFRPVIINKLIEFGSPGIDANVAHYRCPFAFLGQKGLDRGYAFQKYSFNSINNVNISPPVVEITTYVIDGNISYVYKPEDGIGITSVVNWYAVSASGTASPTSGWSQNPQSMSASKRYLWNYEVVTYSDGHSEQTDPCVIGVYGEKGDKGDTGSSGKGIKSIANKYAVSSNGTTAPSTWVDTPPSMTKTNKYLWNYEIITYTDNSTTETKKRVIGVYGDTGSAGKGISSITEYYLVSSSATGVTTGTSGWSTTPQQTTSGKPYLWNYEVIIYTDQTRYTSTPVVIGTRGESGAVAKNLLGLVTDLDVMRTAEWEGRWYADGGNGIAHRPDGVNAFGLDVSRTAQGWWSQILTPGDALTNTQWMRAYGNGVWTAWVEKGKDGANGTPGQPGEDGRTPYVHFAYANSADGSVGFSTTDSAGKLYIGQYVDYTQEDSTNPSMYAWTKIKGEDGESAQYIYVRGVNYEQFLVHGDGFIEVNGKRIVAENRAVGLNLITLKRTDLTVVDSMGYKYNVSANGDALAEKLNSLDDSVFVCIYGADHIGSLFTSNLVSALERLGSPSLNMDRVNGRYAFAFLGQVGLEKGYAFLSQPPRKEGDAANGPLAEVSAYVVNGAIAYNYTPEDGVGISGYIEYYLVSSSKTGVTTSTPGWSTTIPETSNEKPYLWNYEVITYTDGTKYTSTPRVIGAEGQSALTMVIDGLIVLPSGGGTTTLKARLFQQGLEIDEDGSEFIYTWESYNDSGDRITTKTGKTTTWTVNSSTSNRVEVRCTATEIDRGG